MFSSCGAATSIVLDSHKEFFSSLPVLY